VQHWLQTQTSKSVIVGALATRARLGERTFLRRFVKATGMTPIEYHQHLRIARTRELLEFTSDTVEQIATAVGYEDTGGLRKTFKRVVASRQPSTGAASGGLLHHLSDRASATGFKSTP
jgi:transcriptional regulator GlxA family with amidase domain